jgi:hypothetical protein
MSRGKSAKRIKAGYDGTIRMVRRRLGQVTDDSNRRYLERKLVSLGGRLERRLIRIGATA